MEVEVEEDIHNRPPTRRLRVGMDVRLVGVVLGRREECKEEANEEEEEEEDAAEEKEEEERGEWWR